MWVYLNAAASVILLLLMVRAWNLGNTARRAEAQSRKAEDRFMGLLLELAKRGLR